MNVQIIRFAFTLFFVAFSFIGCGQTAVNENSTNKLQESWEQSLKGSFSEQVELTFDSLEIEEFFKIYPQIDKVKIDVGTFYRTRAYAYAWFENGLPIEQAGNLYNRIINLEEEGIYQTIPYRKELDSLFYAVDKYQKKPNILLELMLTAQYFAFSKLSWDGMDKAVSESLKWHLPRKKVNYEYYLDSLLKYKDLDAKEPVYRQYALLKDYLKKYKALEQLNNWNTIQTSGTLIQGDTSNIVTDVKKRFYLLGDYKGDTTAVFDEELYQAVESFQKRNGLSIDGKIGPETIRTLNIPLKSRIRQIIVNMERNRWLPISTYQDVLAVNIPDFKLHVFHADTLLWNCNVVVGQTSHPTTLFYGEVKYVVFRPYWNIPESIVRNEILPHIRKKPNYISTHDMEITGYRNGLPIVRQKPGANNSLGLVKFLFPNSYNTYLHDTPAKSLFGETSRAFSHGCIRVEQPVKLANFLLRNDASWTAEKINSAMKSGNQKYVTLKDKVPVFIAYFTAFVGQDKKLNFRKDIYDLDERLADMILDDSGKAKD